MAETLTGFVELLRRWEPLPWAALVIACHIVAQLTIVLRVIMRRRSVGESLAWIMIVFVVPFAGLLIYLLIGEFRLGNRRARRIRQLFGPVRQRFSELDRPNLHINWHELGDDCEQLARAGQHLLDVPALPGNELELIGDWQQIFHRLIADIDAAKISCELEFYIWHQGGRADDVVEAIIRAARRGVQCRILLDALGSQKFLRGRLVRRLRESGAEVRAALPGGLWRVPFVRFDLRLHRKIVIIDSRIAYTGSLNLVDPRYFKQDAGVGQWVDAMVRIRGPGVEALAITFRSDWYVETDTSLTELSSVEESPQTLKVGSSAVQALPSGPAHQTEAIEQILITAIYAARRELVLTTPYFVPSEALLMALISAAQRGVKVIIILPARVDSMLVRLASRAYKMDLLNAGVYIAHFSGGLLHTKSGTIDGKMSLFGSLNLDPRSFRLNFEITLAVYDRGFTERLRALQQEYLDQSELADINAWRQRGFMTRFTENVARLFGPLL